MEKRYYTAGEVAKISGVSARTIRYYDEKGLLKPTDYSDGGYRYYNEEAFTVLQRILMFKYLGFSLDQINTIIQEDFKNPNAMKQSLYEQKQLLIHRMNEMRQLVSSIEVAEQCNEDDNWDNLIHLLNLLTDEQRMEEQYTNDDNLNRRINIHTYNTNKINLMDWIYEYLNLKEGMKILEIGCGNALLWRCNIYKIPKNTTLYLTDNSLGMLESAQEVFDEFKDVLAEKCIKVQFQQIDANKLYIQESQFDVIIANHMLYHVDQLEDCLSKIKELLKEDGSFFCSTIGINHMKEIHQLLEEFDTRIDIPLLRQIKRFSLINAGEQLQKFYPNRKRYDYDSDLIVDNAQAIWDYVYSFPGNAPTILDTSGEKFMNLIQNYINKDGALYIHKETGMFECKKSLSKGI